MTRVFPGGMTPKDAHARMIELREAIARCNRMNIVEMIPELENEWEALRDVYLRQAYP